MDQLIQDAFRLISAIGIFFIMCLIGMAVKWLLNLIWEWIKKGCKSVWKLSMKAFKRTEITATAEKNMEV